LLHFLRDDDEDEDYDDDDDDDDNNNKVKLSLCLIKHHAIKYLGSGGIAPRILDSGTR
jgi:hypothetical protein